jgi:hypothetical protein
MLQRMISGMISRFGLDFVASNNVYFSYNIITLSKFFKRYDIAPLKSNLNHKEECYNSF